MRDMVSSLIAHPAHVAALLAAAVDVWAAWLWLKASRFKTTELPPIAASASDVPELYIYDAQARLGELQIAMASSAKANARAAIWTGLGAALAAVAVLVAR